MESLTVTILFFGFTAGDILATSNHPPHMTPAIIEACITRVAARAAEALPVNRP